ncbi:hypothetical protein PF004_g24115 [Phytophthora fragariae]|uniref:RIIa domain-containing protein n=1 Tax=Phytophthora fragariae TaxID=53985 RepID=A0A6A3I8X0_9STRA|nr:hypothetical protein PF011_g24046 [Phytophthora fragariae]KAE9182875.1 hypothetical protein PF004_g24115 [Phytophthora fragariae]
MAVAPYSSLATRHRHGVSQLVYANPKHYSVLVPIYVPFNKKTRELNGLEGQHPIDLAATGSGAGTFSGVGSLSFEELLLLNERKEALKKDYAAYVESHPEIKTLLSWFMSALLLEKPQDVVAIAADHFSAFLSEDLCVLCSCPLQGS